MENQVPIPDCIGVSPPSQFDAADPAINTAQIGGQYGKCRLEDSSQLLSDIQTIKPTHVFNAAGVTGRPNLTRRKLSVPMSRAHST
ncbi:hypothetical protein Tco_0396529 [Tanacetum coccineum]